MRKGFFILILLATLARASEPELAHRQPDAAPTVVEPGSWIQVVALLQLPIDLFSMRPLRYSREKGMLWSVGANELDDGGDDNKRRDIVIRLPEPHAP